MTFTDLSTRPAAPHTATPASKPAPAKDQRPTLALAPLIALSLGYFLVMLDVTVVNVAIPDIRASLDVGASGLQWIVDGYSTVFAGLLLLGGSLADRLGHRRMFLTGLGVFTVASLACGVAASPAVLIAGRLAQGAGAALLVPASLALLQAIYPDRAVRARAIAIWGAVASIAFGAGPAVGGLLVSGFDWRAVFWLNVPVGALAVHLTLRHIPASARKRDTRKADPLGQALGIFGLISLTTGLNEAGARGWTSPLVLSTVGLGAAALIAFARVERSLEARAAAARTERAPLLPPSLFRSGAFTSTAAIGLLISLGYYGMLFLTTLYFQQQRGFSVLATGLALLPSVCMGLIAAPLFSRLTARTGPYIPMAGGLLLGTTGFLGWLLAGPDTPYPVLLFALIATGLGQTMTALAATAAIIEAAPASGAGIASAVFNVARQVGSAVGVALFGAFATASGSFTSGLHLSTAIAATAFATGALLALTAQARTRRTTAH
ncbi:DHA2 family efflux MFS transporter permease subunit [Actinomadura barringtoniae]|uniref:DHA2 family efflux MFS transporter permease subunit n=1 Tax=Actinomadura barringtoniae TaxID=1427535 RepID=A0A939T3B9_9ACTN|nr:MFS transporter [Actinomadura barringtoniae]MBO2450906.1 DHA2 family efflux MFS transporter permease subunit [Actinomadura barringtoniae]